MTTLLLDIGNSRLKWGLLVDGSIGSTGHLTLSEVRRDGASRLVEQISQPVESVLACNVAGNEIIGHLAELGDIKLVRSAAKACGVTNSYQDPEELGVDRWVAMIGARAGTNSACLIVDAGTAVTLDLLDPQGRHHGGQILPGFRLMTESLGQSTSDLPLVDIDTPQALRNTSGLANSTNAAIAQGVLGAILGAVERSLRSLTKTYAEVTVILTGGDAEIIHDHLQHAAELRPHLVLEGLARTLA